LGENSTYNWCSHQTVWKWLRSFDCFGYYKQRLTPTLCAAQKTHHVTFAELVTKGYFGGDATWKDANILYIHYDEKWFWGLVLRARAKYCPSLGLEKNAKIGAKNIHHINKVMAVAVVAYAFKGGCALNGGDGLKLGLYRCARAALAGKTQYQTAFRTDGSYYYDHSKPPKYKKGEARIVDCNVTGSNAGTAGNPSFDLLSVFKFHIFPLVEQLVGPNGQYAGYKVVIQGDGAGPHRDATYMKEMKDYCGKNGWRWITQAAHMAWSNVLDLLVFPMMPKRHDSVRFQRTSVLKCDEIWKHTLDVWKEISSAAIAEAFIIQYRVMEEVIKRKGETSWQAGGAGHYGVRKEYMETETGMMKKPVH